jgi:uncharacterized DUF497 family protein
VAFAELAAEWDDDNLEHIAVHGIEPQEIEEVVFEDCYPSWIVRNRRRQRRRAEPQFMIFGQTCGGRYLVVVIAVYRDRGVWRPVTAWPMEPQTRRRYQQWRGN